MGMHESKMKCGMDEAKLQNIPAMQKLGLEAGLERVINPTKFWHLLVCVKTRLAAGWAGLCHSLCDRWWN